MLHLFTKEKQNVTGSHITKMLPLVMLKNQIVWINCSISSCSSLVVELANVSASSISCELRNTQKATAKNFTRSSTEYSWKNMSKEDKVAFNGKMPMKTLTERIFGSVITRQVQIFSSVNMTSTASWLRVQYKSMVQAHNFQISKVQKHSLDIKRAKNILSRSWFLMC